ncbi:response regulator [Puniceibacterium sediminis]|uniref:Two-component system, OmpR family, response regulator n=1 Tax=Puniceibacterium sediminis TaxID=1608407 RepID=A0A238X6I9_9RHOB|nr:response regulator transcription factor [Puniceibacterium sediminis]SNR54675.1 two-component system, OmpR family, response regulator [Puniceibacterium sediminis]
MNELSSPQIMIVDDARDIRDPLAQYLKKNGLRVRVAENAKLARKMLSDWAIHLVVLDIMMPGEDGLSLCRYLVENRTAPVIFLTACTNESQVIAGLELGADDYITKPFNPPELLARIRAVLRRVPQQKYETACARRRFEQFSHNFSAQCVYCDDGAEIMLTTGENKLLSVLLDHPNEVVSRTKLLDAIRGREAAAYDRAVDNLVSRLRRKLGDDSKPHQIILTNWGGGYRIATSVEYLN